MSVTYTMGYKKGANSSISVSAQSDHIAKAAAELLNKSIQRSARDQDLIKGLTEAAIRWQRKADSFKWTGSSGADLEKYYKEKAGNCIKEAARVIVEGRK